MAGVKHQGFLYASWTRIVTDDVCQQCVSTGARAAIGLGTRVDLELVEGDAADFAVFGSAGGVEKHGFRYRTSVQELVFDACRERVTVFGGRVVGD